MLILLLVCREKAVPFLYKIKVCQFSLPKFSDSCEY